MDAQPVGGADKGGLQDAGLRTGRRDARDVGQGGQVGQQRPRQSAGRDSALN